MNSILKGRPIDAPLLQSSSLGLSALAACPDPDVLVVVTSNTICTTLKKPLSLSVSPHFIKLVLL
jgi:hypothetical protein